VKWGAQGEEHPETQRWMSKEGQDRQKRERAREIVKSSLKPAVPPHAVRVLARRDRSIMGRRKGESATMGIRPEPAKNWRKLIKRDDGGERTDDSITGALRRS